MTYIFSIFKTDGNSLSSMKSFNALSEALDFAVSLLKDDVKEQYQAIVIDEMLACSGNSMHPVFVHYNPVAIVRRTVAIVRRKENVIDIVKWNN